MAVVVLVSTLLVVGIVSAKSASVEQADADTSMASDNTASAPSPQASTDDLMTASGDTAKIVQNNATGVARFVSFPQGLSGYSVTRQASAEDKADAFLANYGAVFGLTDASSQLSYINTVVDNYDFTHVNYVEVHDGVNVYASTMRVHFNADGELTAVNGTIIPKINGSSQPKLTPEQAGEIAVAEVAGQQAFRAVAKFTNNNLVVINNNLYYYHTGLIQSIPGATVLAYEVEVSNSDDIREFVFVNAYNGNIVDQFTGIYEGAGADREISETSLGNVVWDESAGDPDPITAGWAGGTVQQVTDWQNEIDGSAETYNTIDNLTGGTYASYDGAEATMRTVNNDPGISCPNANWNGISTNYCTDVTGDDTVAHEWGHAYTEYTHNLVYAWQPGALNESYSDIWGEIVDLINGRGIDTPDITRSSNTCSSNIAGANFPGNPTVDTVRWLSGEDDPAFFGIPAGSGNAIRDMWDPTCFGDPGKVGDTEYHCEASDGGGVHTNSGVPNHAFALLVDGGTYNGQTITGIGLDKSAHIYWRSQSVYQSISSDFVDHASAIAQSCTDLVGQPITALSSVYSTTLPTASITAGDCIELDKVIAAVELNTEPTQCGFEPAFVAAPPLCEDQGTGVVNTIYTQTWESGATGWVTGTHDVENPPTFTNPDWTVIGSLPASRPGNAMFVEDSVNRGACTPADTVAGALNLDSPIFTVPAGVTITRVAIDHFVATEVGWDGGNVKINVNGGGWAVLPDSAYSVNGYFAPGAINGGGNDNPLAGEEAFTGGGEGEVATGWGQSQLVLLGYVNPGDEFQLRFDMGLDGCNGVDGWYVDDFEVYSCAGEESAAVCGNSVLETGETCDDGNTGNGDGCSDTCQVENGWSCEDPIPANPDGANVIADWSFEDGTPNAFWNETSTNFGTPLCDVGSCGVGGGTGPYEGSWWTWFGGIDTDNETGSIDQDVIIPSTAMTMTFWLEIPTFETTGLMDVKIDGTSIFSVTEADNATYNPYMQVELPVAAYADDSSHNILFEGSTVAGGITNFFVDAVTLSDNVATDPIPSVCSPLVEEVVACNAPVVEFEYGIPISFTVENNGGTFGWTTTDESDCAGGFWDGDNQTGGSGEAACVDADGNNGAGDPYDTELWTNSFDLNGWDTYNLDFLAAYNNLDAGDFFDVDISINGGVSWTNELSWNEDHYDPGEPVSIDLADYAGETDVIARFRYYGDGWDWWAEVDDIGLNCVEEYNYIFLPVVMNP